MRCKLRRTARNGENGMTTYEARTISVSIDRDWREAYAFACQPENVPLWASGLASGLEQAGEDWTARGPGGPVRIRFSPPNPYGVLDHVIVTEEGAEIRSPFGSSPTAQIGRAHV